MSSIHQTAVVSPQANIGSDVVVGPFCVVEPDVTIGDACVLDSHVVVKAGTSLGLGNRISAGAVLGGEPQHATSAGETGELRIGDHNEIREYATVHRALHESDATTIGDQNLIMVGSHVGHDCCVGNRTIIANNVMLAGHVRIDDRAYISGAVGVHQFCRVGTCAMVGGQAHVSKDVPPFVMIDGRSSRIVGLNVVGMKRAGIEVASLLQLKLAYRIVYRSNSTWQQKLNLLKSEFPNSSIVREFREFLESSKRGCTPERKKTSATHTTEDTAHLKIFAA